LFNLSNFGEETAQIRHGWLSHEVVWRKFKKNSFLQKLRFRIPQSRTLKFSNAIVLHQRMLREKVQFAQLSFPGEYARLLKGWNRIVFMTAPPQGEYSNCFSHNDFSKRGGIGWGKSSPLEEGNKKLLRSFRKWL